MLITLLVPILFACGNRVVFSNVQSSLADESNVAIIKDDYFHFAWCIKSIEAFSEAKGKFEQIYNQQETINTSLTTKFVLAPGEYIIRYEYKHYKMPLVSGDGKVTLKAGHEYRVKHATCSLYHAYKRDCDLYTAAIWFEDLTTGEVLSGDKWEHLN